MFSKDKFEFIPKKINNPTLSRKNLENESNCSSCLAEPDFFVVCGFFQKFAHLLKITVPNFRQLQDWMGNTEEVHSDLHNLLVQLFQRGGKSVRRRNFEQELVEFSATYSAMDAQLLEQNGFAALDSERKLRFFKELLESLFVTNENLSQYVANHSSVELRSQPLGRDRNGRNYVMRQNGLGNWAIYAKDIGNNYFNPILNRHKQINDLISQLGGDDYATMLSDSGIDEDSSSSATLLPEDEQQLIVFLSALKAAHVLK